MSDVSSEPSGGAGSWTASEPTLPETGGAERLQSFIYALREEKSPAGFICGRTPGSLPELHGRSQAGKGQLHKHITQSHVTIGVTQTLLSAFPLCRELATQ